MNTPPTGLDFSSRRIFTALLIQVINNQYSGWRETFVKGILWYHQSQISLIPDFIPGIGFIDRFILAQSALWLLGVNPDQVAAEDVAELDEACKQLFIEVPSIPSIETSIEQDDARATD